MQRLLKSLKWLSPAFVMMLLLTACFSNKNVEGAYPPAPTDAAQGAAVGSVVGATTTTLNGGSLPLGLVTGALLGASIGSYRDVEGAVKSLNKAGITVVRLGDIVEVVIPHDLVFDPETYDLTHEAESLLNQVVALLQQYGDVNMSVVGHSDNLGTPSEQLKRSKLQAQVIMSYIWSHGIAIERLSFYGVGATQTTASLKYANGQAYNRRVVIVFWRKAPPGPLAPLLAEDPDCWTKANPEDCNGYQ